MRKKVTKPDGLIITRCYLKVFKMIKGESKRERKHATLFIDKGAHPSSKSQLPSLSAFHNLQQSLQN